MPDGIFFCVKCGNLFESLAPAELCPHCGNQDFVLLGVEAAETGLYVTVSDPQRPDIELEDED